MVKHLQAPFRGPNLTPQQDEFNKSMSEVRTSVEWVFEDIVNFFKFLDFKTILKVCLSLKGKMYLTCALMHNCRTCLYGNQVSQFFDFAPPLCKHLFIINTSSGHKKDII